jgi:aspartate-semialdehyde dehydrogenase
LAEQGESTIALIGAETLLGREIRDHLGETGVGANLRLITEKEEEAGILTEAAGEPAILTKFDAAALNGVSAIILAGSPKSAKQVLALKTDAPIIDVAAALEENALARLRAPLLEPHDFRVAPDAIQVIAHPAATALALALSRIHQVFPIRRSIVHIFEPVSERGAAGIDELQQQTVSLLSFKPLPKEIYDTQISYTMLAGYGEEAPLGLNEIEARIERHLATLLSFTPGIPIPSVRLIQAPVFHGYSFSLWLEFDKNPGVAALQQVLNEPPIDVHGPDLEPPNNVGVAGHAGVAVGAISADRNQPQAAWLWMAADNLRLAAENTVLVLREVI